MEEPVTIVDRDVLKVLAVDTRIDILKELSKGNRTPSDLSKKLDKSDATIVEHLDTLCKVGLVNRIEQPGKKWVFYSLTERGEGIIKSKSRRLVIILSISIIALIGSFTSAGKYLSQFSFYGSMKVLETNVIAGSITIQSLFLYLSIGLFVLSTVGFLLYIFKKLKMIK